METLLKKFKEKLQRFSEEESNKIIEAADWAKDMHADQKRVSGEPYFIHPLHVAEILIDMQMDYETIIAALLHDLLEDTEISNEILRERFGRTVETLVEGVTKISVLKSQSKSIQEAETIRKMLLAMTKDIRVILIKLADKLHNMSTLTFLRKEKRVRIANECLEIYAPLAGRLGISWLKAELEDLALKNLQPVVYQQIKEHMSAKKLERSEYLNSMEKDITHAMEKANIEGDVATRAKHFYSIYKKMKNRNKNIDEIFDLYGIRIFCTSTTECYTLLGLVHSLWIPIEGRFKDFIAMPKANQYQSLHTTVMSQNGRLVEIQIRTHKMHETAEFGVAAHWIYKQGRPKKNPKDFALIDKLKHWDGRVLSSRSFLDEIKEEILKDSIYVFTPKGHIIELPKGSTPIDFAYHIHTEVGDHCHLAKADGNILPLNGTLKNTQVIEVLTSPTARPHYNWLRVVKTSRAKTKIRQWLNKHDENLLIGKNIIAKNKPKDIKQESTQKNDKNSKKLQSSDIIKHVIDKSKMSLTIGDEKNLMIAIAKCCQPTTGDDIIGYVSRGRGIIVHRRNCPNLKNIQGINERSIDVEWEAVSPKMLCELEVFSHRTSDLFSEIEGAIRKYKGHLIAGSLEENDRKQLKGRFTMEIERSGDIKKILKSIRLIPSVINLTLISQ